MSRRMENRAAQQSRRERWQGLITEWSGSGQTHVGFCRARGLNSGTFAWWKRQLRRGGAASARATVRRGRGTGRPGRFVEVRRAGMSAAPYEIVLGCGRTIRVSSPFDAQALSRLIAAVESASRIFGGAASPC